MIRRRLASALLLMSVATLSGCGGPIFGLVANAVMSEEVKVQVDADYRGLENKTVAVLVNLNEYAYAQHPNGPSDLTWAISKDLRANIPDVKLINPDEIIKFQEENPYWNTLRYSHLIERLQVDRVVLIDVLEYSTHEPGNTHILQGKIIGDVKVIEAESSAETRAAASELVYSRAVDARYPEDDPIGVLNGDERTVEVATLVSFARKTGYLFYDHTEMRKR